MQQYMLAAAVLVVGAAGTGRADIVVSSLSETQTNIFVMFPPGLGPATDYAQEFSTGSQGYTLTDIQASLSRTSAFDGGVAYLLSDNSGSPGTPVAFFTFPPTSNIPTSGYANITVTPTTGVTLAANTDYWFALGNRSSGPTSLLNWANTTSTTTSGPGSLGGLAGSTNRGGTWSTFSGGHALIQVDGTPTVTSVPEPSSALAVGFAALAALCMWARRRRAARGV
jgi:hypothetical protein